MSCPVSVLVVRPIIPDEQERFDKLMAAHHYLGFPRVVWERILYVAERQGQWLALLAWTSGAQKVGCRDRWIGWDDALRQSRLRLIANNTRFLILPDVSEKNLASQILSLNLKRLSRDWQSFYGHPILLAETFVDPKRFRGTCYCAANWTRLGQTRGFGKKNGRWVEHGHRKWIFVFPIGKRIRERLSDPQTDPVSNQTGVYRMNTSRLPMHGKQGLLSVLRDINDPRSRLGRQHPLDSIVAICLCAVLSGARSYQAIADWAKSLTQKQLLKFGIHKKRPPSEPCIRRVLQSINAQEVDDKFSEWFHGGNSFKNTTISLDGKALKGARNKHDKRPLMLLSAVLHHEKAIIAQTQVSEKSNEIPAIKDLLAPLDITGSIVTLDALHTQVESSCFLVKEKHADFFMTVKENQPKLLAALKSLDDKAFSP